MMHIDQPHHTERWRPVIGYEGLYSVSNLGRIRRDGKARGAQAGHVLRSRVSRKDGRERVNLNRDNRATTHFVHRLVAAAWSPGRTADRREVNHINGDTTDNRAENLEWVTRSENLNHAYATGLLVAPRGNRQHLARLTEAQVRAIRASSGPMSVIARFLGVSYTTVFNVRHGRTWRHVK